MDNSIKSVSVVDIWGWYGTFNGSGLKMILIFAHKFTLLESLMKALPKIHAKVSFSQQ